MPELSAPFAPDSILPPGQSMLDIAGERGWTQAELAVRLGCTEQHLDRLIDGGAPVTPGLAQRLAQVLGSTPDFWLALEANHQKHLGRLQAPLKPE